MANLKDLLVSGAAKLLSTLRVSGDTHIDGTLYLNGAIGSANELVYVDSTGKFVAGKNISNVTNYDSSVAIKTIARTANATSYTLTTVAGATSTVATPVAASTKSYMAYYTDAYNIGGASYVAYLGHAAAQSTGNIDGLLINGDSYGEANDLISGVAGQMSYGDAGPQIRFNDSGQTGAIIFSRWDNSSGLDMAFHFVPGSGGTRAAVKANGLIARDYAMIGGNSVNTSYPLYVNGNTFQNGIIYGRNTNNYIDGKVSGSTATGWRINPRVGINIDPSTSYNLYVSGNSRINGDLTIYKESTTAQNLCSAIYLSNKDTTTGYTENVTIAAYNSHSENYGSHLYIQTNSSIEIYAGDGAHTTIRDKFVGTTANSSENLWLGADGEIIAYSNGNTAANRIGFKVTSGNVVPWKAEAANTNVQTLGVSGNRWKAVYIGTNDTYGSQYQPIYWNAGVPTQVTANSVIVNLASTSGDSVFQSAPRPGVTGTLPTGYGGTGNTTFTASRLIYSNTATKLATGNIVSEGNYISNVTYLTINSSHQTNYRLYVNGNGAFTGNVVPTVAWQSTLGTSTLYWKAAYIDYGGGSIRANNIIFNHNSGVAANKYEDSSTDRLWFALSNHNNGYVTGNKLAGLPLSAVTVNYTTDGGSTWATSAGYVNDARKMNAAISTTGFPVGNATVIDSGTNSTAPDYTGVGCGVEVIFDTSKDGRLGYIDMFSTFVRTYCRTATFTLDVYQQSSAAWVNVETITLTDVSRYQQITLGKGFYLNGAATSTGDIDGHSRINKIRYRLIVTAVTDATGAYIRYAPCIGGFQAWGINGASASATATYSTTSRLSYCMARWNMPIMLNNFSEGNGVGSVRIPGTNIYFGDDMYYAGVNVEKWTTLVLGNSNNINTNNNHSQGRIQIYSAATHYHMLQGTSTTANYTHYLPNQTGWIVTGGNGTTTGVGSATQPVYLDTGGKLQTCTSYATALAAYLPLAGGTVTGQLVLSNTTDAAAAAANNCALIIGGVQTAQHIEIDGNEILSKSNGTTPGTLYLQEMTGIVKVNGTTAATSTTTGALQVAGGVGVSGNLYANRVYNAVWNDYAEMRTTLENVLYGQAVIDNDNGTLSITNERLMPGAQIVSDTWGSIMGETDIAKTPVAVAGRVLAYPYRNRIEYHAGQAVCSAPNGTVDIMTREEIMMYPDAIIGIVSEIPEYDTWGSGNIKVNGRIWIHVR